MSTLKNSRQKITSCLWFDNNALEAVNFYISLFENSEITKVAHYGKNAPMPEGSVLTVEYRLAGQEFLALNGGPVFTFSEAVSFIVNCDTQEEIDHFWDKLSEGGQIQQCGWLKDKFGVSWQIVPSALGEMMVSNETERSERVMQALLKMVKLDLKTLKDAFEGN